MGDKFSWDRLLKRGKDEDNTIQMNPEQINGPVAPLKAGAPGSPIPAPVAPVIAATPPPMAPPLEPAAPKAPLVIDWDDYQSSDTPTGEALPPISIPANTEAAAPSAPAAFWDNLTANTHQAIQSAPPLGTPAPIPPAAAWEDVELTPKEKVLESEIMAGTFEAASFKPIQTNAHLSAAEMRSKAADIANDPAWGVPTASNPPAIIPEPPRSEDEIKSTTEAIANSSVWDEPIITTQIHEAPSLTPIQSAGDPPSVTSLAGSLPPPAFGNGLNPGSTPSIGVDPYQPTAADTLASQDFVQPPVVEPVPTPVEIPADPAVLAPPPVGPLAPNEPPITNALGLPPVEAPVEMSATNGLELPPMPTAPESPVEEATSITAPPVEEATSITAPPVESAPPVQNPDIFATQDLPVAIPEPAAPSGDFWANVISAQATAPATVPDDSTNESGAPAAPAEIPESYTKIDEGEVEEQIEKDLRIGDLLLKHRLVAPAQLERALERQRNSQEKLGQVLISMGLISERRLLQVLAAQKGVSPWDLADDAPSQDALRLVPHETCKLFQVLPVAVRGDLLLLAMANPADQEAMAAIRELCGKRIEPVLADEVRLSYMIDHAYGLVRPTPQSNLEEMVAIAHEQELNLRDGTIVNPDLPDHLIALMREFILDAEEKAASSITILTAESAGEVWYRIHGRLSRVQQIPLTLAQTLISGAQKELESELLPFQISGDYKAAVASGQSGATLVVTFPQVEAKIVPLAELEIETENLRLLRQIADRPYGLLLIAGSARSGKHATIASLALELEQSGRAVARATTGESIAEQINLAVTSESEVIIVGELDNEEDIRAAVKAASAGHLIVAEITANDAPTAIQQIIAFGADPYLLANILIGVWCQAMAPKLCLDCRTGSELSHPQRLLLDRYGLRHVQKLFEAPGCPSCTYTGVAGQVTLSEILPITADVGHLIAQKAPVEQIAEQAGFGGYLPMDFDAVTRMIHGDVDYSSAKRLVWLMQSEISPISRKDSWETQAS
jgi:type IV pilus assembly protein PilB